MYYVCLAPALAGYVLAAFGKWGVSLAALPTLPPACDGGYGGHNGSHVEVLFWAMQFINAALNKKSNTTNTCTQ